MINAEFGLYELAIEPALHERQRPKLGRYPRHLFLSASTVSLGRARRADGTRDRGVHHRPRADHRPQGHRV
jgi:Mg2+ and Co2+ transporter CorA